MGKPAGPCSERGLPDGAVGGGTPSVPTVVLTGAFFVAIARLCVSGRAWVLMVIGG